MEKGELAKRLMSVDYPIIEQMSPEIIAKLTNSFEESYVKLILYKGKNNAEQRKMIIFIKSAYKKWKKNTDMIWGSLPMYEHYPDYLENLQLDIECGKFIMDETGPDETEEDVFEKKMDDYMERHTMTPEDIQKAIAEVEGESYSDDPVVLKARNTDLEEENQQQKEIIRQQGVAAVNQDEVDKLKASIARLENDLEAFNTQDGKNRMTASQAAIFILTVCHHLGGLPNDKKALSPILQWGWGFSESTSERALGAEAQQSVADKTAQFVESFSPKLGRLIREFPDTFNELRKQKLKDNNDKKVKNN